MRAFQDYEIGWRGQSYVIPSNRLLPVIAAIEEVITLQDLLVNTVIDRMPAAKVSCAYAVILRAAGVKAADGNGPIGDQEVYAGMFDDEKSLLQAMAHAVGGLLALMIPPEAMPQEPVAAPGKPQPASRRSRRSRRSTKRRSARAG